MTPVNFASDNVTGACPEVMQAIVAANEGAVMPYGNDPVTQRVEARLAEIFERPLAAFPVATGTACNALTLACVTPPYGAVYCHQVSHINTDECGAPEFYSGGAKLVDLPGEGGKLTAASLAAAIEGAGVVHHVQPAAVSLTQASEAGTVYSLDEIAAIAEVAHAHGLKLHLDGARFANALVALGCTPAEMTWQAGVDLLSFGATKNGCLSAEAAIFFDPADAASFGYRRKRAGHLFSKMRVVSAQLEAYLADDLWLRNARHANALARRLAEGLAALPGVRLLHPCEANEVFADLPQAAIDGLLEAGFYFYVRDVGGVGIRLVTAWNSREEDVEAFLATAGRLLGAPAEAR
jgi:threonine aldolase